VQERRSLASQGSLITESYSKDRHVVPEPDLQNILRLSQDYLKFIVRSTYDGDLQRAKVSLSQAIYEHYHRRTGHFLEGDWIEFARKIWGSARKMNSRTNMIKQDETRKLDYIDCGKSLKNLY